jgi:O-antigen/teichoic acid export membrane protein
MEAAPRGAGRLVLRNTGWLVGAQVLGTPLAIAVNAVMARQLGPVDFGYVYLAGTLATFAFLLVDCGQTMALPGIVARDRSRSGALLGTALAWRAAGGALVIALLAAGCRLVGCGPDLAAALLLVAFAHGFWALGRAALDAVRGFERTDVAAAGLVGQQFLGAALVVPTLLLGGGLSEALGAQVAAAFLALLAVLAVLRPLGMGRLAVRREALGLLVTGGAPFLLIGLATTVKPNVDVLVLARFVPAEVIGWHGAALKLVGALVFPATSLIAALYPTLFRLHAENPAAYRATASAALRTGTVAVVPLALGCGLFPELGIWIFGEEAFAPAEANLRILAAHVFLIYFSMTIGCCLAAAGRERAWALAQVGCVVAAAALDLLLVPLFQAHTGNGGLGIAVSLVACEVLMLAVALVLVPRGVVDRAFLGTLVRALAAGGAMAGVAALLSEQNPIAGAAAAGLAYLGALALLGGLDREQRAALARIFSRRRGGAEAG